MQSFVTRLHQSARPRAHCKQPPPRTATPPWFTSKPRGRVDQQQQHAVHSTFRSSKIHSPFFGRFRFSKIETVAGERDEATRDGLSPFSLLPPRRRRSQAMPMRVSPPRHIHRRTCPRPVLCDAMPPCDPHLFPRVPSQTSFLLRRGVEDDELLMHEPAKTRGSSSSISSSATPSCAGGAAAAPHAFPPLPPFRCSLRTGQTPAPPAFSSHARFRADPALSCVW